MRSLGISGFHPPLDTLGAGQFQRVLSFPQPCQLQLHTFVLSPSCPYRDWPGLSLPVERGGLPQWELGGT